MKPVVFFTFFSVTIMGLAAGCGQAAIGSGGVDDCVGGDCTPNNNNNGSKDGGKISDAGTPYYPWDSGNLQSEAGKSADSKIPTKLPDCKTDADCNAPLVCHVAGGKCVPPEAKSNGVCDPVEGIGCPSGLICVAGICLPPPGSCTTNGNCPLGWICVNGTCAWPTGTTPGCTSNTNCPTGQVCVNGKCLPKAQCQIPHSLTRMKGNWYLDSNLHVRDGLKGFMKGLLGLATTMQNIITGKFSISGVPSIVSSLVAGLLQNAIKQYVPPWGTNVIQLLAHIDDAIDDTRVTSLEHVTALGNDQYSAWSEWLLVEFEFQGQKVSNNPANIPGLGKVTTTNYTAREICGMFFMDKHKVKNSIGHLYKWAVEALITGISCSMQGVPCYKTIQSMFDSLINCPALAKAVAGGTSVVPGLEQLVLAACTSQKSTLTQMLIKELNDLSANMTYMELAGVAEIKGNSDTLSNGKWYGSLGGIGGSGSFEGTFKGNLKP